MVKISKEDLRVFNAKVNEYLADAEKDINLKRNTKIDIKEITDFAGQEIKDIKADAKKGLAEFDLKEACKINKSYKRAKFLEYVINGIDFKLYRTMKGINYDWDEKVELLIYSLEIMEEMNRKAE